MLWGERLGEDCRQEVAQKNCQPAVAGPWPEDESVYFLILVLGHGRYLRHFPSHFVILHHPLVFIRERETLHFVFVFL